jgi:hypothetical protein
MRKLVVVLSLLMFAVPAFAADNCGEDVLKEVNALRAQRGLPPYAYDAKLAEGAAACAKYRADHLVQGHTRNDFGFLPNGTRASAAGCAAWPVGLGWGSCCVWDNYRYAGAAWAMGSDGKRYMHLFVR